MEKINKYSPGMHIPIVSMNKFKNNKYDFTYLFAWNHKKEIFQKKKNTLNVEVNGCLTLKYNSSNLCL